MAAASFPSDPAKRKVILILAPHEFERCSYEPGAAKGLLDEEACVLRFPLVFEGDTHSALQSIVDARLARAGSMLVQSPFDPDTYEEASLAPERFALTKHMHFSTFCRFLGAKEVSVEQVDRVTRKGKSTLDAKGERLGSSVQMTLETEELEKFRAQMHLRDEFSGGPADVIAAEQFLRRKGLWADPSMQTLLEMRREGTNQLLTRRLVLSLSNEAKRNLNVITRLKLPAFVKLSAEHDRKIAEQCDYTLTVFVRF